jgi:hypothetical protein
MATALVARGTKRWRMAWTFGLDMAKTVDRQTLWSMDRPLGNRQMPVDGQTLGQQTDASGWTDSGGQTDLWSTDRPSAMDRPSVNRQNIRQWTDLWSTDRPSAMDRPSVNRQTVGDGQTFGQQTDRLAMNRPSVNRQTVWQWTDLWSTDRPSGNGLVEDRQRKIKVHQNPRLTMSTLDAAHTPANRARDVGVRRRR